MKLQANFVGQPAAEGSSPALISGLDGSTRETDAGDINSWLSAQLQHEVSLWPLMPAEALDHYRRGAPDTEDFEQELRTIFARTPDEPLPDLEMFAEVMEFESPQALISMPFPSSS
jgi:hypothetical protein